VGRVVVMPTFLASLTVDEAEGQASGVVKRCLVHLAVFEGNP
jgi:hypothetical protein